MKHLSQPQAEQYLQKKVGKLKTLWIKQHIKKCQTCKHLLDKIRDDIELMNEIKNALNEQVPLHSSKIEQKTLLKIKNRLETNSSIQ
jgi:hypothetical protein